MRQTAAERTFFYPDPVAALWMVKTFRMTLLAGSFCLQPESIDAFLEMLGRGDRGAAEWGDGDAVREALPEGPGTDRSA